MTTATKTYPIELSALDLSILAQAIYADIQNVREATYNVMQRNPEYVLSDAEKHTNETRSALYRRICETANYAGRENMTVNPLSLEEYRAARAS